MIDFSYAQENIHKYKFDYHGYLVIVDQIRTTEILSSCNYLAMKNHLNDLKKKYRNELSYIAKFEKQDNTIVKNHKNKIVNELKYISKCLPVIGFMILGKGKEIGIDYQMISTKI